MKLNCNFVFTDSKFHDILLLIKKQYYQMIFFVSKLCSLLSSIDCKIAANNAIQTFQLVV